MRNGRRGAPAAKTITVDRGADAAEAKLWAVKILVLGSGAREHAIITALLSEPGQHDVVAAPGNAGIALVVPVVGIDAEDPDAVVEFAQDGDIDLVVVGPEAPLVAGVADALRSRGIPVFGPGREAAALEGSKTYAKHIMAEAGVPTGRAERAGTLADAERILDEFGAPYVVKADGLAAGKGVLVTENRDEAIEHSRHWLGHGEVLIEEFLDGQEVSLFLLSDGHTVRPLSPAQDYKRLSDGDEGPNTGGMGAYSPLPWLDERFGSEEAFVDEVIETIALPTIRQLAAEEKPFIGLLYCGLILTNDGIRVIEFNARFGDPETQVVLPRLETPLARTAVRGGERHARRPAPPRLLERCRGHGGRGKRELPGHAGDGPGALRARRGGGRARHRHRPCGDRRARRRARRHRRPRAERGATASDFAEARRRAYEAVGLIGLEGVAAPHRHRRAGGR